jgi:hypothetical protein
MNIKLNIKSIVRYEQLTNKPFSELDYTNIDDLNNLLYCIVLENNDVLMNFKDFDLILNNKRNAKEIYTKFNKINHLIQLFSTKATVEKTNEPVENIEPVTEKPKVFVKDIAAQLIIHAGLDANYVMNDLSIVDLGLYSNAYKDKVTQDLEIINYKLGFDRLWTWFNVITTVGTKTLESPKKLFLFPWETNDEDTQLTEEFKNIDLEQFRKDGEELIKKITKQNN